MEWFMENWYVVIGILALLICIGFIVYNFFGLPTSTQIAKIKEWLKYAVTMAEKELGSGTGQLKLRYVYDLFISKFSWASKFISFETFSSWVDDALEWLNYQLANNTKIESLVSQTTITTED